MSKSKFFHAGNLIIAGFVVMLIAMTVLVYLSMRQNVNMSTVDYYKEEVNFDKQQEAKHNAANLEGFKYDKTASSIAVSIPTELANTLDEGKLTFYCLANDHYDYSIPLEKDKANYNVNREDLRGQYYILKFDITSAGKSYFKELNMPL